MEAAKQRPRKRISKKRKSAWRKHVLVKEVGDYFHDKRIEERLGCFANDQDVENLFTTNDEEIKESAKKRQKVTKDVVLKSHFPPSLDDHIKPIRHPAPNKTKARDTKPKITLPIKVAIEEEEEVDDKKVSKTNFFDIWGAPKPSNNPADSFREHGKRVCKEIRAKPPSHFGKKPNENRAIPIPLPGTSYNPSAEDHKDIIMKAFGVEEEKERKEQKILNGMDNMFPLKSEAPTLETWLEEMSAGQFIPGLVGDKEEEEEEEDDDDDGEVAMVSHNAPVRREDKKTEKERRKMKERKLEEKRLKMEKERKEKEAEKFKINTAKKKIKQEELKQAIRQSWRRFDAQMRKNIPKKLGRTRFQEPDIDLKLSDEITDSLRNLKPEGHILKELVSSIQRRSMAPALAKGEPKKRQRRYKPKVFEKPSHKAITI